MSEQNQKLIDEFCAFHQKARGRSKSTVRTYRASLRKLGAFLENKSFSDATKKDLMVFFQVSEFNPVSRNNYGARIQAFYRWLEDLSKRKIPERMEWFEYASKEEKQRNEDIHQLEGQMIERDEYMKIIEHVKDNLGMEQAMWEVFYLTGGRNSEIAKLRIKDVKLETQEIILWKSKTQHRKITFPEEPYYLIRWLGNHPKKLDPEANLWVSLTNQWFGSAITTPQTVLYRFKKACERAGIDHKGRKLTPHCFRKTRATIYWSDVNEEGYHKWDVSEVAYIFGWSLETAEKRRHEYQRNNVGNEIHEKLTKTKQKHVKTYDVIETELEERNKDKERIDALEKQIQILLDTKFKQELYNGGVPVDDVIESSTTAKQQNKEIRSMDAKDKLAAWRAKQKKGE